jgi:endonuclease YncB( thermonuclease family)
MRHLMALNRIVFPLALFIVTVLLSIFTFSSSSKAVQQFAGQVVGVIDGDSLRVMHDGRAEQVRLNGVDCPEKGQPFGQQAKKETSALAFGLNVTVHPMDTDKYGRTVATVILPNGKILNHELVKDGWCWWFRKYAPSNNELEGFEQAARQAKKGIWVDPAPVPPWEYRKTQRSPKNSSPSASSLRNSVDLNYTSILGNRDSHLYHRPDCPSYDDIAPDNRVAFASESAAAAAGYRKAGNCP